MPKTVLIVDDSATMLLSLKTNLEIHGFKVEQASNGKQALDKVKSGLKPDLIITDINMPEMDGLEFIKNVRPILKFTPILILTTESEQSKREQAKKTWCYRLACKTCIRTGLNKRDKKGSTRSVRERKYND